MILSMSLATIAVLTYWARCLILLPASCPKFCAMANWYPRVLAVEFKSLISGHRKSHAASSIWFSIITGGVECPTPNQHSVSANHGCDFRCENIPRGSKPIISNSSPAIVRKFSAQGRSAMKSTPELPGPPLGDEENCDQKLWSVHRFQYSTVAANQDLLEWIHDNA